MTLPPIPAIGNVSLQILGPGPAHARWDVALWGEDIWSETTWQDVTPQSLNAKVSWGADDGARGVMSVAAAGTWNVSTYDPDRKLDPANTASQFSSVLHPGVRMRIVYASPSVGDVQVKRGIIDEITYDIDSETGSIRCTDYIAVMQGATIPAATPGAPTTLRARARWALAKAVVPYVTVEDDPEAGDPTVGPAPTEVASVWDWIGTAALDVLHAYWIDGNNVLKFRSYGDPRDEGLAIGGVDGIPIDNVTPISSLAGLVSTVIGYDVAAPTVPIKRVNSVTQELVGDATFERTRPVPGGVLWVVNTLADLSGAALQFALGTIRPRTDGELLSLLSLGMVDVAHLNVTHRNQGREELEIPINAAPRILGGTFQIDTQTGWSAGLATYVTAAEWENAAVAPPPVIPPDPPVPPPFTTVTRTYLCIKDSRAYQTSGGANYGSGTESELPVGAWSGGKNRAFLGFSTIPWTNVKRVVSAELRMYTSSQVNIGFGSSPKIRVYRVTQNWSEGTLGSPGSGNALVYPGPTCTSTGEAVSTVSESEGALEVTPITLIARAWAPASAGGSGAKQYGVRVASYGESSSAYTTEFWAREHGSGTRPEIRLTLEVYT